MTLKERLAKADSRNFQSADWLNHHVSSFPFEL